MQATTRNTPPLPAVRITRTEHDGHHLHSEVVTPAQARSLAEQLHTAADRAERNR